MTTVGIVGVGLLGDAIASRLRAAGHAVVGYDVVTASMDRLAALGGTPAKSAGDVARAAEVVCTILPSLATVEEAILGPHCVEPLRRQEGGQHLPCFGVVFDD